LALVSLQVSLHSTAVRNNSADVSGGGCYSDGTAAFNMSNGTIVERNTARSGGGVALADKSGVILSNSFVTANSAALRGGGIAAAAHASLGNLSLTLASVVNNTARYGDDIAADPSWLTLLSKPHIEAFVSRAVADGGFLLTTLNVSGLSGLPSEGVVVSADLGGREPLGLNWSDSAGISNMFLRIHKPPGRYHMTFSLQEFRDVPAVNMSVQVRGCVPGEVSPIPDTCEPCLPGSYSLDTSQPLCQGCPEGASCPGGAVILPLPGWWHSAADSVQLHRCDTSAVASNNLRSSGRCLANTAHAWLKQLCNVCAGSLLKHCILPAYNQCL
jgi:hypothetical protein